MSRGYDDTDKLSLFCLFIFTDVTTYKLTYFNTILGWEVVSTTQCILGQYAMRSMPVWSFKNSHGFTSCLVVLPLLGSLKIQTHTRINFNLKRTNQNSYWAKSLSAQQTPAEIWPHFLSGRLTLCFQSAIMVLKKIHIRFVPLGLEITGSKFGEKGQGTVSHQCATVPWTAINTTARKRVSMQL